MKVKLLKKTKKRFSIYYYPIGGLNNKHFHPFFRLIDKEGEISYRDCFLVEDNCEIKNSSWFKTKKECMGYLQAIILDKLRGSYPYLGRTKFNNINNKKIKVW